MISGLLKLIADRLSQYTKRVLRCPSDIILALAMV
jgi:hypothetical protein